MAGDENGALLQRPSHRVFGQARQERLDGQHIRLLQRRPAKYTRDFPNESLFEAESSGPTSVYSQRSSTSTDCRSRSMRVPQTNLPIQETSYAPGAASPFRHGTHRRPKQQFARRYRISPTPGGGPCRAHRSCSKSARNCSCISSVRQRRNAVLTKPYPSYSHRVTRRLSVHSLL
jgi:hypothetical protein